MTNSKSTKRALLLSVLSLIMCVSMLIGTTFAWFTDSVTSGRNVIQSGNLDVELEYSTDMVTWTTVDANTNIFDDEALWEPGYTEVVYLRVTNAGSLAMKYKLGVNVASETLGKTKDGKDIKLSDYIEYGVIEEVTAAYSADERMTARADISAASKLNVAYEKEYALVGKTAAATDSDTFALVVYMPESVGNEANHNGTNKPVINLGLTVVATQNTVEEDSFNNQYDANADYDGEISNVTSFAAAMKKGGTYKLTADINNTEAIEVPADVSVVLNLNGKTFTTSAELINNGTLTVQNGTAKNEVTNGKSVFRNKGTMTLVNMEIVGAPSDTSTGNASYAVNTTGAGSTLNVIDSKISGRGTIGATNGTKVEIQGGTFHVPVPAWGHAIYADGNGTEVVINGGTYSEGFDSAPNDWTYMILAGNGAKVTVNDGSFTSWDSAALKDYCELNDNGTIEIYGGTFMTDPTEWVADGYVATKNADGTYTVAKKIVPDGTTLVSEGLYVDANGVYYITNATGLVTMGTMVADEETYDSDGTWILYNDIDMTGVQWAPINGFHGTFDGNGKTISNLTVSTDGAAGLFGKNNLNGDGTATMPVIKNLTISNANVTGNEGVAVVVGNMGYAAIEKVTIIGATVNGNKYVGGIIGTAYTTGGVVISDCSVIESAIKAEGANANGKVGGIGGFVANGTVTENKVEKCTISGPECVGGIVGRGGSGETVATIYGNTVSGNTVTGTDTTTVGEKIGDALNVKDSE